MSGSVSLVVTASQFRIDLPEFANTTTYTDAQLTRWLTLAQTQLNPLRWADLYVTGIEFWVAHMLALGRKDKMPNANPGTSGLILSKNVGRVSIDFDTTATSIKNGGPWNLTTYGTQFLWFAQMVGAGGMQVNGPFTPDDDVVGSYPTTAQQFIYGV